MIVKSKAPCRISLFGGGTDIESYFIDYGGLVINLGINLRSELTLYTGEDTYKKYSGPNIVPYNGDLNFMHKIFTEFNMGSFHDVKFKIDCDGLLNSGLGSSASSAVATVGALNVANNLGMTRGEIAEKAWFIEVKKIKLFGGRQDQYAATFGGVNMFEFTKEMVNVTPLGNNFIEKILPSLVLLHVEKTRENPKIQEGLKKLSREQIEKLNEIKQITLKAIEPIGQGDIEKVAHLLDRSWRLKQRSNKDVTAPWINKIYEKAKKAGALGGKMCGSGGGGYMIYIVKPNKREEFIEKMKAEGLTYWDFSICWNGLETRIL